MATGTKAAKGFRVVCPMCGDIDATVSLDLNDVRALSCSSCDGEFSPAEAVAKVADQLRRWQAIEKWIGMAGECLAE